MSAPEGVELSFPEDGGCFGCSPTNDTGLQLRFRRQGTRVVAGYRIPDRFHGAPGIAHGGIVAAILDEISCAAGLGGSTPEDEMQVFPAFLAKIRKRMAPYGVNIRLFDHPRLGKV